MRLGFAGTMLGRHPGFVPGQGEQVAALMKGAGHQVSCFSSQLNRYARLVDISTSLFRLGRRLDAVAVDTYSGAAFVNADAASAIARATGVALVLSLHGGALPEMIERRPRWTRRVLLRADVIVCQTEYLARTVRACGFDVELVPNLVRVESYPHLTRERPRPRLFWMRTFDPAYDPLLAVRVLERVRRARGDATLVMAGRDEGLLGEARALAHALGLSDAVRFPGFLDHDAKVREASAADFFLNTNRVDNTPVSVIEAAAFGLIVVATRAGGVPDLVTDGENGLLVPMGDADAMASAILRALEDSELAKKLSEGGRELAARSSPSRVAARWDEVFRKAVSARRR